MAKTKKEQVLIYKITFEVPESVSKKFITQLQKAIEILQKYKENGK